MTEEMHPTLRRVWLWHALEELEHQAVAFELYRALGGGYVRRVFWMNYVFAVFAVDISIQVVSNLRRDRAMLRARTFIEAAQFFFGRPSRAGGWIWLTAASIAQFFRPDFSPQRESDQALIRNVAERDIALWRAVDSGEFAEG